MKPPLPTVSNDLKQSVVQLYEDYAEVVDNLDLDAWSGFFTDDCKYLVTARENYEAGLPTRRSTARGSAW